MRVKIGLAVLAALLAGTTGRAGAQSLYGPGGLALHPTASVPEKGQLTPGVLVLPQHNPVFNSTRTWQSVALDYGATEDLEIGATYLKVAGWNRDPSVGGFAKYRLLRETESLPAIAVGFTVLAFGDVNARVAFLAARKQLTGHGDKPARHPVAIHLGAHYAKELDGFERNDLQPYGGIEVGVARRLTFIAEARPRGTAEFKTPFALTLAYAYGGGGRLAVTWANNGLSNRPMFGVGAGISLGAR